MGNRFGKTARKEQAVTEKKCGNGSDSQSTCGEVFEGEALSSNSIDRQQQDNEMATVSEKARVEWVFAVRTTDTDEPPRKDAKNTESNSSDVDYPEEIKSGKSEQCLNVNLKSECEQTNGLQSSEAQQRYVTEYDTVEEQQQQRASLEMQRFIAHYTTTCENPRSKTKLQAPTPPSNPTHQTPAVPRDSTHQEPDQSPDINASQLTELEEQLLDMRRVASENSTLRKSRLSELKHSTLSGSEPFRLATISERDEQRLTSSTKLTSHESDWQLYHEREISVSNLMTDSIQENDLDESRDEISRLKVKRQPWKFWKDSNEAVSSSENKSKNVNLSRRATTSHLDGATVLRIREKKRIADEERVKQFSDNDAQNDVSRSARRSASIDLGNTKQRRTSLTQAAVS